MARSDSRTGRDKTESCIFCGLSEARGAKLVRQPGGFFHKRFRCQDNVACDQRCRNRILMAGAPKPPTGDFS